MITEQDIRNFQDIYRNCYGEELALADARTMANSMINLYRSVLTPHPAMLNKDFTETLDDGIIDEVRRENAN